ncbi:MAG: ATPase, T2SS/T4P/T4SS family [Clostridiales bacterium]|nr:ATPase, T2SS/T4P/T4SS family [Clostridiales bacterium]
MAYKRLGEVLIAAGAITDEELGRALALQKEQKGRLGDVMIRNNLISENELIDALQMQLGIEFIDLSAVNIPTELARVVPKNVARQYQIVPVKQVKDELYLAMSDPLNFMAIEDVRKSSHKKIIPMIATASGVERAIATLYGNEGAAKAIDEMKRERNIVGDAEESSSEVFAANQIDDESNVNSAPTIRLVNSIIDRAVLERASDIHLEPHEFEYLVRMRVDGVMRDTLNVPKNLQNAVISRIKIMSGLDISEKRIPQDGRFYIQTKGKNIDLRVSTLPTVYGEKIVIRLLDKSAGKLSMEAIGLEGEDEKKFRRLLRHHSGVILIAGPTGSGKSSTMYTMINELNTPDVNFITLEDPVEYNIDRINQVQINEKVGMTFAKGLRSILRQDPDIIAVGEIRDGETADIAMRAAITGHLVLSTIHTNDSAGTIDRLVDSGCERYLIASALKGVISQRLLRKVCPECKYSYIPDDDELEMLGLSRAIMGNIPFYKGAGCAKCFNTGYSGRTAVFEILPITREIRECIVTNAGRSKMDEIMNKQGVVLLRENALRLVVQGVTSTDEVLRVTSEED